MEIIQINASYKPAYIYGGPTMSVSKLCEELAKAGKNIEVLTTTANGVKELDVKAGIQVKVDGVSVTYFKRITKGNSHFSPDLLVAFWKILKKKGPKNNKRSDTSIEVHSKTTIVHIHAWWNLVSITSCFTAILFSKTVIISPRGTLSNYSFNNRSSLIKNIFHNLLGRKMLKRCHFHVTSQKEKQDINSILVPKTITVLANFVELENNLDATAQYENFSKTGFRLIFLSRIEEKKGIDILFHALNQLSIPYHLTIAGTGDPVYILALKRLATDLGLSEKINWIGQQDKKQKFKQLACHDIMILPSHDESFANVVIESLSVGTPVIISSKVGLSDYVSRNNFGWVFTNAKDKLHSVIIDAYSKADIRTSIRHKAPQQIRQDYNDENLVDSYIELYDSVHQ